MRIKVAINRLIANVEKGKFMFLRQVVDFVDVAGTVATLAKLISKPFSDSSSVSEQHSLGVSKNFTDTGNTADTQVKSSSKVLSDSTQSSDSGSLLSQSYVDNTNYFAEDYVGAKRTF